MHVKAQIRILGFHVLLLSIFLSCLTDEIYKPPKGKEHIFYLLLVYISHAYKVMIIIAPFVEYYAVCCVPSTSHNHLFNTKVLWWSIVMVILQKLKQRLRGIK